MDFTRALDIIQHMSDLTDIYHETSKSMRAYNRDFIADAEEEFNETQVYPEGEEPAGAVRVSYTAHKDRMRRLRLQAEVDHDLIYAQWLDAMDEIIRRERDYVEARMEAREVREGAVNERLAAEPEPMYYRAHGEPDVDLAEEFIQAPPKMYPVDEPNHGTTSGPEADDPENVGF